MPHNEDIEMESGSEDSEESQIDGVEAKKKVF